MTFALDAETHRRLVPPRGAARDRRHPGRPFDLRLPRRPGRQGRLRPEPRRQRSRRTPTTRRGRSTCARASSSPTARRSTRQVVEGQPRRLPRQLPRPRQPLLFTFVFNDIKTITVTDPMTVQGRHDDAVGVVPGAPLRATAASASWRETQLHDGKNCFKDMIGTGPFKFKGDWVPNDHLTVVKNPNYWRKDSVRPAAAVPRQDHLQARPRRRARC